MSLVVGSPVHGVVVALTEVPDPVFAEAMVGPGVAVVPAPTSTEALSPIDGTIATLHPHAFVVATDDGPAVLVHLGIDTVKLKGAGFTLRVAKGDRVTAGQPVVGWDPGAVEAAGYSAVCPVIALDAAPDAVTDQHEPAAVESGEPLFTWR